ncbi:MAG: ribonuclease P protein component 4 [Halobacteriaceae archaeon]
MTIPEERIRILAGKAKEVADTHPDRSREYVRLAKRLAERHRLELPTTIKRFTCDQCDRYLIPGNNAQVRTQSGHVVITCECGEHDRYPY